MPGSRSNGGSGLNYMRFGVAMVFCLLGLAVAAPAGGAAPGLVAAYAFDEGSGDDRDRRIRQRTHGSGDRRNVGNRPLRRRALVRRQNDYVGLPGLGTFYNTGFTLEAWVQKANHEERRGHRRHVGRERADVVDRPSRDASPTHARRQPLLAISTRGRARSSASGSISPPPSTARLRATTSTAPRWRHGPCQAPSASPTHGGSAPTGSVAGGFFDGADRRDSHLRPRLSTGEVQADMSQPIGHREPRRTHQARESHRHRKHADLDLGRRGLRRRTTPASPATGSMSTALSQERRPPRRSHSPASPAPPAISSESRRSTQRANVSPRASGAARRRSVRLRRAWWRRTRSTRGPARWRTTLRATARTGRSRRCGMGRPAATAARSPSTAATPTSASAASAPSTTAPSRSRHGCRKTATKKDVGSRRHLGRQRPDALGRPHRRPLPRDARRQPLLATSIPARARSPASGSTSPPHSTARPPAITSTAREVASRAVSGSVGNSNIWRIGAYGSSPGGFFDGTVDDVRIYNRALSAGEVQFDMTSRCGRRPDTTPPSQPGTLTATGGMGRSRSRWGAATDNVGVTQVQRAPVDNVRLHALDANRIAQPTGLSYTDTGLAAGTYYYKVAAEDAAGNIGPASNEASATVTCRHDAARRCRSRPRCGRNVSGVDERSARTPRTTSRWPACSSGSTARTSAPRTRPRPTRSPGTRAASLNGSHTLTAVARDTSGNIDHLRLRDRDGRATAASPRRASGWPTASTRRAGTVAADSSGNNLTATAVGATWAAGSSAARASLDGVNDRIDLPALGTFYKTGVHARGVGAQADVARRTSLSSALVEQRAAR